MAEPLPERATTFDTRTLKKRCRARLTMWEAADGREFAAGPDHDGGGPWPTVEWWA
jgi:hypothetical protein